MIMHKKKRHINKQIANNNERQKRERKNTGKKKKGVPWKSLLESMGGAGIKNKTKRRKGEKEKGIKEIVREKMKRHIRAKKKENDITELLLLVLQRVHQPKRRGATSSEGQVQ